jgi:glycosyltransferase involved in cell wall biosynthesis
LRLGLVGWASDTGVGMEIRDALRYLPVTAVFYLDHPGKPPSADFKGKIEGASNLLPKMNAFIETNQIDTILTWETPGSWDFPSLWQSKGIRWFCVVHYDWFAPKQIPAWKIAKIIAPFEQVATDLRAVYGLDSRVLPVPIDLERLPFRQRQKAERFVTVYGHGGHGDRRSIVQMMDAWRLMGDQAPPLLIRAQKVIKELEGGLPANVSVHFQNLLKTSDLYAGHDVALFPSKYEGVGISLMEAQACGLPVITTDMEPMRSIAPDYLVPGEPGKIEIMQDHWVATCTATPAAIVDRVKKLYQENISEASNAARFRIQENYSWPVLQDRWINLLRET